MGLLTTHHQSSDLGHRFEWMGWMMNKGVDEGDGLGFDYNGFTSHLSLHANESQQPQLVSINQIRMRMC